MQSLTFPSSRRWMALALLVLAAGAAGRAQAQSIVNAPWLLVRQGDSSYVAEGPGLYLQRARDALATGNRLAAADALRDAAQDIENLSDDASGDDRLGLQLDASTLKTAADDVETRQLTDVKALDHRLAAADAGLARHDVLKAAKAWALRDSIAAGQALGRAAHEVEHGLAALGMQASRGLQEAGAVMARAAEGGERRLAHDYGRASAAVEHGLHRLEGAVARDLHA